MIQINSNLDADVLKALSDVVSTAVNGLGYKLSYEYYYDGQHVHTYTVNDGGLSVPIDFITRGAKVVSARVGGRDYVLDGQCTELDVVQIALSIVKGVPK